MRETLPLTNENRSWVSFEAKTFVKSIQELLIGIVDVAVVVVVEAVVAMGPDILEMLTFDVCWVSLSNMTSENVFPKKC